VQRSSSLDTTSSSCSHSVLAELVSRTRFPTNPTVAPSTCCTTTVTGERISSALASSAEHETTLQGCRRSLPRMELPRPARCSWRQMLIPQPGLLHAVSLPAYYLFGITYSQNLYPTECTKTKRAPPSSISTSASSAFQQIWWHSFRLSTTFHSFSLD